ncbi:MAG TPA: plastocyanin/azurin family copper-binding protein [Methanocella sp.]|nr:plastocyanin/azurin family copper-binding protein [Methanocella sp.]
MMAVIVMLSMTVVHAATAATVNIKDNQFTPQSVTIKAGDTVSWVNQDQVKHDVDLDTAKSPLLGKGETYSHTFDKPGKYSYDCDVHPFMKGTVIVQG